MAVKYFKKFWNETTGDEITDAWGTSTYYFETDGDLNVVKQLQFFQNQNVLKYDHSHRQDVFGALTDQPLDGDEFEGCEISIAAFFEIWNAK